MGESTHVFGLFVRRWRGMYVYLLAALAATIAASILLAAFDHEIRDGLITHWDLAVQAWVHAHSSPRITPLMRTLTFIGGPVCAIPLGLTASAILWHKHSRRGSLLLLNSMVGAVLLDTALKLHFKRLRPDVPWMLVHEHSFSFPSGHSVAAVVFYGTLLYLFLRWLTTWPKRIAATLGALLMALGIGYSRIYLGAHYPSDVLGGYLCGMIWLTGMIGADMLVRRELPKWVETVAGR